jgi:hypothetical protein
MRALRLPTRASPVTYLLCFRGPRDSSSVRARRCQRSRAGGGPASDQDHCSTGDPPCRCALAWTRVGSLRFPGDPSCAFAPVYDPGRTDDPSPMAVSPVLPLLQREQRLQRVTDFGATAGLKHVLSTLHERCCHRPCTTRFRPAGLPLPGGSRTLWIAIRGFRSTAITAASTLLRGSPPLSGASVLSASRWEPLVPFPLPSPARFSRSVPEPDRASRCLYAGCRSVGIRTSSELVPQEGSARGFDIA